MIRMKAIFNISGMSSVNSSKICDKVAEEFFLVVNLDDRPPLAAVFIPKNAHSAGSIGVPHRLISHIYCVRDLANLIPTVVIRNMVAVINFIYRPFAGHIKESEAMGIIITTVNPNADVPIGSQTSRLTVRPSAGSAFEPRKDPSLRIVVQQFFKSFLGYNIFSHCLSFSKSVIRWAGVNSTRSLTITYMEV